MATLDIVTLAEAKARLQGNVAKTTDDAEIEADITALSALFDQRYGAVVRRTVTDEPVTVPLEQTLYPNRNRVDYYVPAWTELYPIVGTPTAGTGTVIVRNAAFGMVELSVSTAGTISYTAGRFADTASVSAQFKSAFVIALRNWRQADQASPFVPAGPEYPTPRPAFPTFAVPRACDQMLSRFMRPEGLA